MVIWLGSATTKLCFPPSRASNALGALDAWQDFGVLEQLGQGNSEHLPLLKAMATSTYWTRLWIVQEVLLAQEVFVAGARQLINLREIISKHLLIVIRLSPDPMMTVLNAFVRGTNATPSSLAEVLPFASRRNCRDPLDKIYGLLSLVRPAQRMEVDYSLSRRQVAFAAIKIMVASGDLPPFLKYDIRSPLDTYFKMFHLDLELLDWGDKNDLAAMLWRHYLSHPHHLIRGIWRLGRSVSALDL